MTTKELVKRIMKVTRCKRFGLPIAGTGFTEGESYGALTICFRKHKLDLPGSDYENLEDEKIKLALKAGGYM